MKKIAGIILFFLLFVSSGFGQNFQSEEFIEGNNEKYVKEIREKYRIISSSLKKYTKKNYEITDNNYHSYEFYKENNEIRLFKTEDAGDYGSIISEYYFWDNKLFFVFTKRNSSFPGDFNEAAGDYKTIQSYEENRYYFYRQKAFKCTVKSTSGDTEKIENAKISEVPCNAQFLIEITDIFKQCMDAPDFLECYWK